MSYQDYRYEDYNERNSPYKTVSLVDSAEIPLDLTKLKQWLRMDVIDTSDDSILQLLVDQAVSCFETVSKKTLMYTNFQTFRDCWNCHYELRKSPLVSITSVKYNDENEIEQTVTSTDYFDVYSDEYSSIQFIDSFSFPQISSRTSKYYN